MSNRNHFTYASIAPAVVPAMREWTGFSFLVFILWELKVRTKGGKPVTIKNGIHRTSVRFLLDTVLGEHAWPLRLPRQCPGIDNFLINQAPCRRPRSWKVSQAWIQLKAVSTVSTNRFELRRCQKLRVISLDIDWLEFYTTLNSSVSSKARGQSL